MIPEHLVVDVINFIKTEAGIEQLIGAAMEVERKRCARIAATFGRADIARAILASEDATGGEDDTTGH